MRSITIKIETNNDCVLSIIRIKTEKENPNELAIINILKRQKSYYSIEKINNSEYNFINRLDLHVMIYSGK